MAGNYVQPGKRIEFVADAAYAAGVGVKIGVRVGVTIDQVASGATGVAQMEGVYTLPKLSTDVVAQGADLYWDNTNKRLTVTPTANTLAGYAFSAAGSGVTTVQIKLNA